MQNGLQHGFKRAPQVCRDQELQQSERLLSRRGVCPRVAAVSVWIVHNVVGIALKIGRWSGKRGSRTRIGISYAWIAALGSFLVLWRPFFLVRHPRPVFIPHQAANNPVGQLDILPLRGCPDALVDRAKRDLLIQRRIPSLPESLDLLRRLAFCGGLGVRRLPWGPKKGLLLVPSPTWP